MARTRAKIRRARQNPDRYYTRAQRATSDTHRRRTHAQSAFFLKTEGKPRFFRFGRKVSQADARKIRNTRVHSRDIFEDMARIADKARLDYIWGVTGPRSYKRHPELTRRAAGTARRKPVKRRWF